MAIVSKNDPTKRRKKDSSKIYGGKSVKPVFYIDRDKNQKYMTGLYEDDSLAMSSDGKPVKWSLI